MPEHLANHDQGGEVAGDALRLIDEVLRPVDEAPRQADDASRLVDAVLRPAAAPPPRAEAPGRRLQVGPDNPSAADAGLREANRLLEQQDYDKAEPILIRLVKERPRDPEPLASLAVCVAAGRGQFATATKLADRARKLAPGRGCGWFALGYVHLLGSRIAEGYRFLEEGRRRDPQDPRLRWGLQDWEERRLGAGPVAPRRGPAARLATVAREVVADRRVVLAGGLYVLYRAAFLYAQLG